MVASILFRVGPPPAQAAPLSGTGGTDQYRLQRLERRRQRGHLYLAFRHGKQQIRDHVHADPEIVAGYRACDSDACAARLL